LNPLLDDGGHLPEQQQRDPARQGAVSKDYILFIYWFFLIYLI
jgi:hypothetical protein